MRAWVPGGTTTARTSSPCTPTALPSSWSCRISPTIGCWWPSTTRKRSSPNSRELGPGEPVGRARIVGREDDEIRVQPPQRVDLFDRAVHGALVSDAGDV